MSTTAPDEGLALLRLADPVPSAPEATAEEVVRVVAAARRAAVAPRTAGPTVSPPRARRPRRRTIGLAGLAGLAGVAVAAAVASVAVVVLPGGERVGVRPPAAAADPVTVLRTAATAAAAEPFTPPRPDQFVLIEDGNGSRTWRSVDGTRDGRRDDASGTMVLPGCREGVALVGGNYDGVRPEPCTPEPAYRADIPTDPAALQAWLVAQGYGSETNNVAKEVAYLLEQTLLAPDQQGALFTALSTYPGLAISTDGVPPGQIAVTWQMSGFTDALFFRAGDHRYLGLRAGEGGSPSAPMIVVDAVGQTS